MRRAVTASALLTPSPVNQKPIRLSKFVHATRVLFKGGRGGDGCISMLSLFANEFAGPDGGNGGCGGHVVLRANHQVKSLNNVESVYRGSDGERGKGKNRYGINAPHTFVEVPVGTIVSPAKPKHISDHNYDPEMSDIIAYLDQEGSQFIAARGGAGGRGNHSFLSNTNRHPRVAQAGANGEINEYDLRLRLFAHVGLIGLPNVGKSTLLNSLTGAQVTIGNYAFTTKFPQLGIIQYDDFSQVAISDLPGLIEESSKNRGLGLSFLKSVRHCACLLYVIDMTTEPIRQLNVLMNELEVYCEGLSRRPHLILANKMDDSRSEGNRVDFAAHVARISPGTTIIEASSMRGDNLDTLKLEIKKMYDIYMEKNSDDIDEGYEW